jgi:2-dehydropantoate 2-reductase
MTKGHQLTAAIAHVRAAWPAADDRLSWVGGVQNGLAKDDALARAFGAERRVGAVTILAGQRDGDGRVAVTSRGATYLGELPHGSSARVEAAVALLNRAAIPTEATAQIQSALWSKACNAVGVFGVSVLTRGAAVFRHPDLIRAYLTLIRETAAVALAYGVTVGNYTNFPIRRYLDTPEAELIAGMMAPPPTPPPPAASPASLPSMTQDLLAGRPVEVDEIFGDIVARAERVGVPVPSIRLVRDLIRGIDPGHQPPG